MGSKCTAARTGGNCLSKTEQNWTQPNKRLFDALAQEIGGILEHANDGRGDKKVFGCTEIRKILHLRTKK